MRHELKIYPQYYDAIICGDKTFEIRRDDRGFQKGDTALLLEFNPEISGFENEKYTGRESLFEITYVSHYGQKEDYCVFGIKKIEPKEREQSQELNMYDLEGRN